MSWTLTIYWDQHLYSDAQSIHVLPPLASTGVNRVARQKPSAVSETNAGDGKGSPLYRLTHDMWYMRWGDIPVSARTAGWEGARPQLVRDTSPKSWVPRRWIRPNRRLCAGAPPYRSRRRRGPLGGALGSRAHRRLRGGAAAVGP